VGAGVYEIRIHAPEAYRVFYVAKFEEAIYVLHAFQKKTQKTAKRDIEIGRQRYSAVQNRRRAGP
jgi:phage-related protein